MEPTVHDVLAFHRVDRAAYEHLLSLGAGRRPARDAVALLMWLHRRAGVDAVSRVPVLVRTPAAAARLVGEARAALLHGAASCGAGALPTPPLLSLLCGEADEDDDPCVRRRLLASCGPAPAAAEATRRGVAEVLGGVGALVFDDRLHATLRRHEEGGGTGALPAELAAPYRVHGASVRAAPAPEEEEDGRSLFITFSKGFPLTRVEVEEFFTERWGDDCVAKVMMEKTPAGEAPTYGRVVFRRAATAAAVLGGRPLVKLMVNGRHLWARKYVPRPPQH
ncbi:hypothetical protein PAHAL_7G114800 [Panicum hallii]|uniref:RRM domain-containing protein n=1 Tax=Panicum hallii TaxID=206008 RepID=A0A2S3I5Z0_9POAL|nr:hypothetical protein PAHAL_7G114800 [Panicum hallii]